MIKIKDVKNVDRDRELILKKNRKEMAKLEITIGDLVSKDINIDERILKKLRRKVGRRRIR